MPQVIIDRPYTYNLDPARQRTLPRGWRGEVEKDVAQDIKKHGFGRVLGGQGGGAKKAESGGQGGGQGGGGA